jgi:hypothetical protein
MTKTQRIFDALAAMGRPATAKELSEATGISQASVSAVICDRMKYSTSQFSAETFFRDGGGIVNYYSIKKLRPMEPIEIPWHLGGIERHGVEKWAAIVDREVEDMMGKIRLNKGEIAS